MVNLCKGCDVHMFFAEEIIEAVSSSKKVAKKKETIFHLFFHCIYTKIFWVDVENLITRKLKKAVKLGGSDITIYVDDYGIEKDKVYIIQLLVIMGKFHIHKMKWSGGKPIFFKFY